MPGRWEDPLMRNFGLPSRESRIAVALAFAVLFSCVGAFLYSDDLFQSFTSAARWNQVHSSGFESSESLNMSNSELALLSERYTELEKQFKELSLKLQLLEQGTDPAQEHLKAGPFSTVKANRTNPTLTPDETVNPRLAKLLNEIALNNEVIVALATTKVKEILKIWFENIKRVGIRNYLVVALDDDIESFCRSNQVPVYRTDPDESKDSIARNGGGAAISGLKFRILRDFLQLGYSVLVSDTDIIYLQNPFDHLYRDCDVESMSDGFDNMTTYGYQETFDDPVMVWSRFAHTMRIMVFNAGFFYIRSTIPSIELLDRVAGRLSREPNLWDQDLFNEELFFPSHPGYDGLYASKRAMDMYLFMNSKVLFKIVRKDSELRKLRPVIVHVNYYPDKLPRLKAAVEFYVNGNQNALDPLPDGSQQKI